MGVAYRLPSINATVSVTIPAHSILISKSTLLLQAKGYISLQEPSSTTDLILASSLFG